MGSTWWRDESEMDSQQREVIQLGLEESPVLVTGPPGAGKTNLALLRANYLVLSGFPNTVVLTIGKVISNFIYAGAKMHGLDENHVQTFHSWAGKAVKLAGETPPKYSDDYDAGLAALVKQLKGLAEQNRLPRFDAIILDEAQDYPPGVAMIFRSVTDSLFITGDSRQRIFSGTESTLKEFAKKARTIELKHHYRNGLAICKVAGAIKNDDYAATSLYDEEADPSSVERHQCSLAQQVALAIKAIPNQLDAYPDDLVGIMVASREDLNAVAELLDASEIAHKVQVQSSEKGYAKLLARKRVILLTIQSAKGLEFRSAHILATDTMTPWPDTERLRNTLFTAVTRAKTSLSIYHENKLKPWLESAILQAMSQPKIPTLLTNIFPKVKP